MPDSDARELDVLVAGGGVAGLETLLALRDLAGDRVRLTLLTPETEFVYRPMAVAEPFSRGRARRFALSEFTTRLDVERRRGRLAEVDATAREAVTDEGDRLGYDALVVATGGRSTKALRRATTWTPETDPEVFGGILRDLEEGYTGRMAFVVPERVAWPLPAYELALMTAWDARDMSRDDVEIVVVTHEDEPLGVFGAAAVEGIRQDLAEAGVTVRTSARVRDGGDGEARFVAEPGGEALEAQRVVALPVAAPNTPGGLPVDDLGFVPVDRHGRVEGLEDVYAAGDVIAYPVKQGGLAAQQADAVAESIAAAAGAPVQPEPFRAVLRGVVLTGRGRQWIRRDLDTEDPEGNAARHALWWPPTKVAGRYLAQYLEDLGEAADSGERAEPSGRPVHLDLERELGSQG